MSDTIKLLVKGDYTATVRALVARHIPGRIAYTTSHGETVVSVNRAFFEDVASWFNEEPKVAPFPVGSLLHFNTLG